MIEQLELACMKRRGDCDLNRVIAEMVRLVQENRKLRDSLHEEVPNAKR